MKKRFGDRRDAKRVRNLSGMHNLVCDIKPLRCDSDVYIYREIDVTELVKYMEKKKSEGKELTYFHLFCTAIGKVVYNKPLLNRFVLNKKYYDRNEVTLSYVAKTDFSDESLEFMSVIRVNPDDTVYDVGDKISKKVKNVRNNSMNSTDDVIDKVGKLPRPLRVFVMWMFKKLDNLDLLPFSIIKDDIYHSSILVSNLGSIGCDAIYHNLTDFGTNSILLTIGKIKKSTVVINGKTEVRDVCSFGVTLDERIADGFYFVKSLEVLEYILNNPKLLEDKASEKIETKKI